MQVYNTGWWGHLNYRWIGLKFVDIIGAGISWFTLKFTMMNRMLRNLFQFKQDDDFWGNGCEFGYVISD